MVHHFVRRATSDSVQLQRSSTFNGQTSSTSKRHKRHKRPGAAMKDALAAAKDSTVSHLPNLHLKSWVDAQEADWWFAGTAVPLLAATLGPLANVLSIAALVSYWRMCLVNGVDPAACPWDGNKETLVGDLFGQPFADPAWCYGLNILSLVLGIVGNLFLLFNFTGFVRYIVALPLTIIMWYMATGILIAITISMNTYAAPLRPHQTYTQGFWYAVLAAALYLVASMLLMVNMLGYFLGHFPQHFDLTDSQRTLILQTMMFFFWLAAGGGIFSKVETTFGDGSTDWSYSNALYFSDVTILTVGFGDLSCTSAVGRGLVFPYSVGGIIMLGLVITSISKFAQELGGDKVVDKHQERSRARTANRVVTSMKEARQRLRSKSHAGRPAQISAPCEPVNNSAKLRIIDPEKPKKTNTGLTAMSMLRSATIGTAKFITPTPLRQKKPKLLLLRQERDRFNEMRRIELKTTKWKRWTALLLSVVSFSCLWLLGALVFFFAEAETQGLTYFEALYFCYVSLLTIGYGDLAPKSNIGRPFFVVWSLIAVPTMTILVGAMGDTIVESFKKGTERAAEVTILPRKGIIRDVMDKLDPFLARVSARKEKHKAERRIKQGFAVGPEEGAVEKDVLDRAAAPDMETLAKEAEGDEAGQRPSDLELAKRLSSAIQRVAVDLKEMPPKRYCYEEWVEFTKLIKFTDYGLARQKTDSETSETGDEEEEEELIEWDWIGKRSPMMSKQTEPEFVLDRLCESMGRFIRKQEVKHAQKKMDTGEGPPEAAGAIVEEEEEAEEQEEASEDDGENNEARQADRPTTQRSDHSGSTAVP